MFKNTRLFEAIKVLATESGDVRARFCMAMNILEAVRAQDFVERTDLFEKLENLRTKTAYKGVQKIGSLHIDKFKNTATGRTNKVYRKYAEELFSIWIELSIN